MKINEETLPNGVRVYKWAPVFGETRWHASHPDCCGETEAFTRLEAIRKAEMGCEWCGAKPLKQRYYEKD